MTTACALQALWPVLSALTWWGSGPAMAFPNYSPASELSRHDRSRLLELVVVASRLEQNRNVDRHKRILEDGSSGNRYEAAAFRSGPTASQLLGTVSHAQYERRDRRPVVPVPRGKTVTTPKRRYKALRRQRRVTAMDNLRTNYGYFYHELTTFVSELLADKLKPDAPGALYYASLIPDILPPDDDDFDLNNEESVLQRSRLVIRLTSFVLNNIGPYVTDPAWLESQRANISLYISLVSMSHIGIRLEDLDSVGDLQTGIGGLNTGSSSFSWEDTRNKLEKLVDVLENTSK